MTDEIRFATRDETQRALQFGVLVGTVSGGGASIYRYLDHDYIVAGDTIRTPMGSGDDWAFDHDPLRGHSDGEIA